MTTEQNPPRSIYDAPTVVWDEQDLQSLIAAHKVGNFRQALRNELKAGQSVFKAANDYVNDTPERKKGHIKPVNLAELYAVGAHFTRLIVTNKTCIIPSSLVQHHTLIENNIHDSKTRGFMTFGGFARNFSFFSCRNRDNMGEYLVSSNHVSIDDAILKILQRYNAKKLMEDYAAMFSVQTHEPFHGTTSPIQVSTYGNLYLSGDSTYVIGAKYKGNVPLAPESLRNWTRGFNRDGIGMHGYEYLVNRLHNRIQPKIFSPQAIETSLHNAVSYMEEVGALKKRMGEKEGLEDAENVALFLVCNYVSTLQTHLPQAYKGYFKLDAAIRALGLPPITPDMGKTAAAMGDFIISLPQESLYAALAEMIRVHGTHRPAFKKILHTLKEQRVVPQALHETDAIADAVAAVGKLPIQRWQDQHTAIECKETINAAVSEYAKAHAKPGNWQLQKFWQHILMGTNSFADIHMPSTLGFLKALKELGIEKEKPVPMLSGLDAIRYRCLLQERGFNEAVHGRESLVFDAQEHKEKASDRTIMRAYSEALENEITSGRINNQLVKKAQEDIRISEGLSAHNGIRPYDIKRSRPEILR